MRYDKLDITADFRKDPDEDVVKELQRFLKGYGFEGDVPSLMDAQGFIDIKDVIDELPEYIEQGLSSAYKELKDYYYAVPLSLRASGVKMEPNQLLSLLMDRTEFYHDLASSLVRTCRGPDCSHFEGCPYRHLKQVKEARVEDGIECMVDRKVVSGMIESFIEPQNGRPKVDPDQAGQMLLFEQLVQLVVKQRRIMMTMQVQEVMVKQWEILKHKDTERFDSKNYTVHPLWEAWSDTHQRIESVMKRMGVTPEFEIRHDMWETEDERLDADERSKQLLLQRLERVAELVDGSDADELDEKVTRREALTEALAAVRKQQEQED